MPQLNPRPGASRAAASGVPTETIDVDYGAGGNGKSKFWGAIQHVLGPYTVVPHKSLLIAQRYEQHATIVANLFRRRLAVALLDASIGTGRWDTPLPIATTTPD